MALHGSENQSPAKRPRFDPFDDGLDSDADSSSLSDMSVSIWKPAATNLWSETVQKCIDFAAEITQDMAAAMHGYGKFGASEGGCDLRSCSFSVSVGDPRQNDVPLVAVSSGFSQLTGFAEEEVLGKNCRFLNMNCDNNPNAISRIRTVIEDSTSAFVILQNRRKDGTFFANAFELRSVFVGREASGKERSFLVGLQADVGQVCTQTDDGNLTVPEAVERQLARTRKTIRRQLFPTSASIVHALGKAALEGLDEVYPRPRWYEKADLDLACS